MDNKLFNTGKRKNIEELLEKMAAGIGELIQSAKDTAIK